MTDNETDEINKPNKEYNTNKKYHPDLEVRKEALLEAQLNLEYKKANKDLNSPYTERDLQSLSYLEQKILAEKAKSEDFPKKYNIFEIYEASNEVSRANECVKENLTPEELSNIKIRHELDPLFSSSPNLKYNIGVINKIADDKTKDPEVVKKEVAYCIEKLNEQGKINYLDLQVIEDAGGYEKLPKVVRDQWYNVNNNGFLHPAPRIKHQIVNKNQDVPELPPKNEKVEPPFIIHVTGGHDYSGMGSEKGPQPEGDKRSRAKSIVEAARSYLPSSQTKGGSLGEPKNTTPLLPADIKNNVRGSDNKGGGYGIG